MTTQYQLDTLEDAVVAKANREMVVISRECAEAAKECMRGMRKLSAHGGFIYKAEERELTQALKRPE